jgi:naphthoate synthase
MISEIFNPKLWMEVPGFKFQDITYHRALDQGTVRIAINRPEVRNAFRPQTVDELYFALDHARVSADVGVVLLTGNGPSPKDAGWAEKTDINTRAQIAMEREFQKSILVV